ncbi:ATP-binding protein [Methanogenium cariaci]|jgi:CO dehydrogenase maturation factor
MKVVICGKGGSGKSSISAMLAHEFSNMGKNVLVVDTDESNTGLNSLLGVVSPPDLMEYLGGRAAATEKIMKAAPDYASAKLLDGGIDINSLPEGYYSEKNGIRLVSIGKIHEAGEGCACPMGMLAREFLAGIRTFGDDVVIVDTEAGIEHFGRGIDAEADLVLMVIDPSFESVRLAERVFVMSENSGVPVYYILNKWDDTYSEEIRGNIGDPSRIICEINHSPEIIYAGLSGNIPEPVPAEITGLADSVLHLSGKQN